MANDINNDVVGQHNNARLDAVEDSISEIRDTLRQALASFPSSSQAQPGPASGMSATVQQGGQASFSSVPSFLRASPFILPSATVALMGGNCYPGPSGTDAAPPSLMNMANFSQDGLFLPSQQWMSLPSPLAVSVMGGLPPVPGYFVELMDQQKFIDFTLLRIYNIAHLPSMSPPNLQLDRLAKTLQPMRTFEDWVEAWAIFASVVVKNAAHKSDDNRRRQHSPSPVSSIKKPLTK